MAKEHLTQRLHDALHRGGSKVTDEDLAEVTAAVLLVTGEMILELVEVIADLETRIEALEK
ncbi:MAG TPA: hypothetical protein VGA11_02990 [Acidimicrobiia bacterium]